MAEPKDDDEEGPKKGANHITRELIRKRAEHNEGNNIISKMENLHHMKDLEYLNLALNNISKVEGLDKCEFLNKLDLTVNFVDVDALEESMDNLASRIHLRDLYMMGNPAQVDWPGFKNYVVARLPQLKFVDGEPITRGVRIVAEQQLPKLSVELRGLAAAKAAEKKAKAPVDYRDLDVDEAAPYTPEVRTKMYEERHLDSSLIDLDVHPHYVSVVIKSKTLRLALPAEVKRRTGAAVEDDGPPRRHHAQARRRRRAPVLKEKNKAARDDRLRRLEAGPAPAKDRHGQTRLKPSNAQPLDNRSAVPEKSIGSLGAMMLSDAKRPPRDDAAKMTAVSTVRKNAPAAAAADDDDDDDDEPPPLM
ncbi:hypothetical protein JL721_6410 [Aureococcus anophagefferens]|nr:hypothetical protein JL721_6410 [Aureococcus anophagefferens]